MNPTGDQASSRPAPKRSEWSALRLTLVVVVTVFLVEAVIMLLLEAWLPELEGWQLAAIDAAVLILAILPALYLFTYRPLAGELRNLLVLERTLRRREAEALRELEMRQHDLREGARAQLLLAENEERHELRLGLIARILDAQEDERLRVALELHDTVSQDLAAIRWQAERLGEGLEDAALRQRAVEIEESLQALIVAVRRITVDLRPEILDRLGFAAALRWNLERIRKENGIAAQLVFDGEEPTLDRRVSVALYRIFQESLRNVVTHAEAEHVLVSLGGNERQVEMTIEDDGVGYEPRAIDAEKARRQGRGLGLLGIEERARLLGGRATIESSPGAGTTVRVEVPRLVHASEQESA